MNNNIRFAFRNILKNKINSLITVIGLTIAFACLLLIFLYVSQEFSYNNFHAKKNKIFRANYVMRLANNTEKEGLLFDQELTGIIKDKVPQVNNCTAFRSAHHPSLIFENTNLEENLCITEADFFDMFSFKLLFGNKDKLFQNPDEIVITVSLANKFQAIHSCSKEELLGKNVFFPKTGNQPFIITGILEDVPENSSIQFDALIPYKYSETFPWSDNTFGKSSIFYEVNLEENVLLAEQQVGSTIKEYYKEVIKRNQGWKYLAGTDECLEPFALSLNDVYLSNINSDYERTNSKTSLFILSVIGFLILIIACSNFVILSLGQSFNRIGEVSVRKAIGAGTLNIFNLFFIENVILTCFAFILGIALSYTLLPIFNTLAQNEIFIELINIYQVLTFVLLILFAIVLATSTIPIVKLLKAQSNQLSSRFQNNKIKSGNTRVFITLQYILSIVLIILTLSIVHQTNYMKYKDLGFSADNIINLRVYHLNKSEKIALHDQLIKNPGIVDLSFTDRNYVSGRSSGHVRDKNGELIEARVLNVDYNYISTLNLTLLQGENFSPSNSGKQSTIINERLATALDIKEDAVGQIINMYGNDIRIIGIVKDFHFDSMKKELEPLMLSLRTDYGNRGKFIFIKYHPTALSQLIPFMQKTWEEIAPGKEFDFNFWDKQLNERYQSEERWSQIVGYAAIIAIIISSLGLLGLTILVINRRIKEVGIRKINGAKVSEILTMLNKDFIKWVVIAFVIACPIAYYLTNKWLENFAYKTTLSWWIFALAGALALGIALLTVSWQSWNAANRNPVEALRYE